MSRNQGTSPGAIRIRAGVAAVRDGKILLVPHYDTDAGPVQWCIPGGRLELGERLEGAARREFEQETGLRVQGLQLLDLSKVLLPEKRYHSITIVFSGTVEGGMIRPEPNHRYGEKTPRWLSREELASLACHPPSAIEKAFDRDECSVYPLPTARQGGK
jgi:ADP-ribose pyrophosphatase YjhB (NUDIX family)